MKNNLLTIGDVEKKTTYCRAHIYNLMAEGAFPGSISLGRRKVAWLEEEIDQWIEKRIQLSRPEPEAVA